MAQPAERLTPELRDEIKLEAETILAALQDEERRMIAQDYPFGG